MEGRLARAAARAAAAAAARRRAASGSASSSGSGGGIVGGDCSTTTYGCCADGRTAASRRLDACKFTPPGSRVGGATTTTCGGGRTISCNEGTYGCFGNEESDVGACDPNGASCINPLPDEVVIISNNHLHQGQCYQNGDDLLCSFPNSCSEAGIDACFSLQLRWFSLLQLRASLVALSMLQLRASLV